jgi:hypothetical protein
MMALTLNSFTSQFTSPHAVEVGCTWLKVCQQQAQHNQVVQQYVD